MATKQADPVLENAVDTRTKEPSLFKVVFLNDNVTTMDFVVETLVNIFEYTLELADKITTDIHDQGSAVVAVLPYEIAEQKRAEVIIFAKANKFPLQAILEVEN